MGEKETTSTADALAAKQAPEKKDKAEAVQEAEDQRRHPCIRLNPEPQTKGP